MHHHDHPHLTLTKITVDRYTSVDDCTTTTVTEEWRIWDGATKEQLDEVRRMLAKTDHDVKTTLPSGARK